MTLADYQRLFTQLNVNLVDGRRSPHKVCMLLAVLELARSGALTDNRLLYAPPLLERYNRYFSAVRAPGDHPNAYFPFFHLKGAMRGGAASFWHLVAQPGREDVLTAMSSARSHNDILSVVAWASLDADLFELVQVEANIDALGQTLAAHWFNRGLDDLQGLAADERAASLYERRIRTSGEVSPLWAVPSEPVRSAAFRRVVIASYDFQCAATGARVVLPDGTAMVQAAHIRPFADTADDDPCNGLALTPDMHWAMDQGLIAPGPDLRWHVHRRLDRRLDGLRRFIELEGQTVLPPRETRHTPKREALEWRLAELRRG